MATPEIAPSEFDPALPAHTGRTRAGTVADENFQAWVRHQHAGELCTFGPPHDRKPLWVVKFEDASRGEAYFDTENEAVDFYLQVSNSWNCTLLTTVRIPSTPAQGSIP